MNKKPPRAYLENANQFNRELGSAKNKVLTDVEVLRVDSFTDDLRDKWEELRTRYQLDSPYFDFEFMQCVNEVRDDISVAILRDQDEIVGFFPFQRVGGKKAYPVGGLINDYHGIIGDPELQNHWLTFLRKSILNSWRFHSMETVCPASEPYRYARIPCPYIDLSQGFQNYYRNATIHSSVFRRQSQKTSKMKRELGELRLEYNSRDPELLETVIRWKREKFKRTQAFDILSVDWTANLVRSVFQRELPNFYSTLNVLWAGDKLVAAHMGISTKSILHYWFPTFNYEFGKYSPGTQMFLMLAEEAASRGIKLIDLGYGDDGFKSQWAFQRKYALYGCIHPSSLQLNIARVKFRIRNAIRNSSWKHPFRPIMRKFFPNFGKGAYR